jgi:hypothetical protein
MEHRTNRTVCTGYLGNQSYITPLHHISVIPGHSTHRVAVCDTGSTKLGMLVQVKCHVKPSLCQRTITGSIALSNLIDLIHQSIVNHGDILPDCFYVNIVKQPDHSPNAGMVPLFAVASAGERLRKEERGMVAREEVGLKRTCFLG